MIASVLQDACYKVGLYTSPHLKDFRERIKINGAMISEEIPWMQFEAGAHYAWRYTYPLRAVGREDDLRDRITVLADELEPKFEYTAWWYTAFPIAVGKENPVPVFVRGDDVAFGLMHTGEHSITMKGVAVWHADFALKPKRYG